MKAPDSDGIHVIFFKNLWGTISSDCIDLINKIFQIGKIPKEINKTIVALIPKSGNPERSSHSV